MPLEKATYLYVVRFAGLTKIGIAANPTSRFNEYLKKSGDKGLLIYWLVQTNYARDAEFRFHEHFCKLYPRQYRTKEYYYEPNRIPGEFGGLLRRMVPGKYKVILSKEHLYYGGGIVDSDGKLCNLRAVRQPFITYPGFLFAWSFLILSWVANLGWKVFGPP